MVEWYQPDLAAVSLDAAIERLGQVAAVSQVRLLVILTAPTDETLFAVVAADSAEAVIRVCQLAGWHTDRITGGVQARVNAVERSGGA